MEKAKLREMARMNKTLLWGLENCEAPEAKADILKAIKFLTSFIYNLIMIGESEWEYYPQEEMAHAKMWYLIIKDVKKDL